MDIQEPDLEIAFYCCDVLEQLQKMALSVPVGTVGGKVLGNEVYFPDVSGNEFSGFGKDLCLRPGA